MPFEGVLYSVVAAAVAVGLFFVRWKWRRLVLRREEIRQLLVLAAEEAARAELESAGSYVAFEPVAEEAEPVPVVAPASGLGLAVPASGSGSTGLQHQCEVCLRPTRTRCKQCKAVHYCSGKCQIIHWRQGHKDECRPFTIANQNNDAGFHSLHKELKQEEIESSVDNTGIEGMHPAKPTESFSEKHAAPGPRVSESLNRKDSLEVENITDEKEADIQLKSSLHSNSAEFSPVTIPSDMKTASATKPSSSYQHERLTPRIYTEQMRPLSPGQHASANSISGDTAHKSSGQNHVEDPCSSSTSSNWSVTGSEERSISESSRSSSGSWEGAMHPSNTMIAESDDANVFLSHSRFCYDSWASAKSQSDANGVMSNEPKPATSLSNKSLDKPAGLEAISSHIENKKNISGCISKSGEAKCSSSCACHGQSALHSQEHLPTEDVKNLSNSKLVTPEKPNSSISHSEKLHEDDCQTCKASEAHSSRSTSNHIIQNVQSAMTEAHKVVARASKLSSSIQDARIEMEKSAWVGLDHLKAHKSIRCDSLGPRKENMGKDKALFPYELFVKLFNWKEVELSPCGLINCGNSCFANSVLQCLAFTPPLTAYFLQGLHSKSCKNKEWCFACEFEILVWEAQKSYSPLSPIRIISRIQKLGKHLGSGTEEDAHEFLRYAIDALQLSCLKEAGVEAPKPADEETTLMGLTFVGYLRSKIECMRCRYKSERHDRMMDLTVEIEGDIGSLEEALQQFTRPEILDGENKYQCSRCKSYEKAKKKLEILDAPNVLTIALKRFRSGKFGKLNKRIEFPEVLNLANYMCSRSDKSPIYRLYGVVLHLDAMSSTYSGHYVCYVRNNRDRWFRIDDSNVQMVELGQVLIEDAYMLLYARYSPRAPRVIRSVLVAPDPRKAKNQTCKSKFHSADPWDVSTEKCNDCFDLRHLNFQPDHKILEEDSNSSFFSEAASDSSNRESRSTDDSFDPIFSGTGFSWDKLRNSDSDTSSSSSSPSPLYSRYSDFVQPGYPETSGSYVEHGEHDDGFWGWTQGRLEKKNRASFSSPSDSSKQCRNLTNSRCRVASDRLRCDKSCHNGKTGTSSRLS